MRRRRRRRLVPALLYAFLAALVASPAALAASDLNGVIDNLKLWMMGWLAGAATLYLMIGGTRYVFANGDPMRIEKAKASFTHAGMGYAAALFAPAAVSIIQRIVGQ
ncbi:MAG: hypothetical protein QOH73_2199 [Gaiellaceae bacterium]|nr:hypothetical protein [Gaiellaceae bacterium]